MNCFFTGVRLIWHPSLKRYVITPLLINILVLCLLLVYGYWQYDALQQFIADGLPGWLSWSARFLVVMLLLVLGIYGFLVIANLIAAPFNAILAEKVAALLVPDLSPQTQDNVLLIVPQALTRELSKLFYLVPRVLGLLILSLLPGINVVAPFAWLLFGAWMMALQYSDYAADNRQLSFQELRRRLAAKPVQALLFGLPVYFVLAIPILNLILIPVAVAGGTVYWVHHLRQDPV